jgi:asparagine synthetase A
MKNDFKEKLTNIILDNEGDRYDIFSDVCNFIDDNKDEHTQAAITSAANMSMFLATLIHGLANGKRHDLIERDFREVQDHMQYLTKDMNELNKE